MNRKRHQYLQRQARRRQRLTSPRRLQKIRRDCAWHRGERAVPLDGVGCQNCSRLLDSKPCRRCGGEYLDWSGRGYDDICAPPRVTSSGDLACAACIGGIESRLEQACEEDGWDFNYEP